MQHAAAYAGCPSNAYNLRLVHTTVTKARGACPPEPRRHTTHEPVAAAQARAAVNALLWSPDGTGRLLSGSNAGEFQLWHGATFGYEAAMQSHESVAIRSMTWSHDEDWLVSGDDGGTIKYSKTTLNIVKDIRSAHKEAVTGLSFAPSDVKFVSGSDDTTVKARPSPRSRARPQPRARADEGWRRRGRYGTLRMRRWRRCLRGTAAT